MRKIFLDIGAHWGETLEEVLSEDWRFDHVYGFEPDPDAQSVLHKSFAKPIDELRLTVVPSGLSDRTGSSVLYGDNNGGGASLFSGKTKLDAGIKRPVSLIRATDFLLEHVTNNDLCIAKMNCEGAEIAILHDLLESGALTLLDAIMIDFDIAKVRGHAGDARAMRNALDNAGFNRYQLCSDVMIGDDHRSRIRNWLAGIPCANEIAADRTLSAIDIKRPNISRRLKRALRGY